MVQPPVKRISQEIIFDSDEGNTLIKEIKKTIDLSEIFSNQDADELTDEFNQQTPNGFSDFQSNPRFTFGQNHDPKFGKTSSYKEDEGINYDHHLHYNNTHDHSTQSQNLHFGDSVGNRPISPIGQNPKLKPKNLTKRRSSKQVMNMAGYEGTEDFQFKVEKFKFKDDVGPQNPARKFSGIKEEDYFVFVEDYDKFIGEFVSDDNVKIVRGFINSNKFNRIYYTKMMPQKQEIIANILIVHGFGHSGKFLDLGAALTRQGLIVHLFDLRGFGFSGGNRFNPNISDIHQDIFVIIKNSINKKYPLFLYGHSYGASILFLLLLRNKLNISGIVLSSMMTSVEHIEYSQNGKFKLYLMKQCGEFFKDFVINNVVNPTALTKNSYNIKRFVDDRICVPFLGLRFVSQLVECFEIIKQRAKEQKAAK